MGLRLPHVLLKTIIILEHLAAPGAIKMAVLHMLFEILVSVKVFVAILAISVVGALDIMFFEAEP